MIWNRFRFASVTCPKCGAAINMSASYQDDRFLRLEGWTIACEHVRKYEEYLLLYLAKNDLRALIAHVQARNT